MNYKLTLAHKKESYLDQVYQLYLDDENYLSFGDSTPVNREKYDDGIQDPDYDPIFILVDEKDSVVASCETKLKTYNRYTSLNPIVAKKYRGKGIDKKIIVGAIEQLKIMNLADYVEVHTYGQTDLDGLLISLGFTFLCSYPDWIKIFKEGSYKTYAENMYLLKIKD
jgi:predicted GNAT family N-acyltransferase